MNVEQFKTKYEDLINLGVIKFTTAYNYHHIIIDRYVPGVPYGDFLCESKKLNRPRADVKKMGYVKGFGIGTYIKSTFDINF